MNTNKKFKIIAISRQFGSGGRTIGKLLSEQLDIPLYDREIISHVAKESGFAESYIEEKGEYGSSDKASGMFINRSCYTSASNEDTIWNFQTKFITEHAEKEPCIIIGRCADYILRDRPDVLRVFIHADMEERIKRITEVYKINDSAPEKLLHQKDKRRAAYYQFYTDIKWGDTKNFHITLDSSAFGIEKCVEILKTLYLGEK
ncbi:MAG: cytidylate kinase-like family protein [Treponema porcinum]|uniref:cytidylate kinase-like family protein n=1 Tax=Treponema porcinum TaxID=261392 RepID=UPI002A7F5D1E|nr:cytidylate kinase-like family protein [Treponema porcinum]MDY5122155.1 cytidylate kinase-like family protein [Treponema porcinum]